MNFRWQAFVDGYFAHHMNATDAYCEVYGVDRIVGAAAGARLLRNVRVSKAIKARLNENAMSADEVLNGLADIARGNIADLMDITTSGFTLNLLTKNTNGELVINPKTKLIKRIKQKVTTFIAKSESDEDRETIETEIELYSAHEAYRDLGKYHALFTDKQEVNGEIKIEYVNTPYPASNVPPRTSGDTPESEKV